VRLLGLATLAASALLAAGCGATGHIEAGSSDAGSGKKLFQEKCASCHILSDADAKGTVGPNLDDAFGCALEQGFEPSTIRDVVRGQIDYASPPMPRKLVKGDDAVAVSEYVTEAVQQAKVECSGDASLPEPTK
jgi:mono/diheme cytochrome c family protein